MTTAWIEQTPTIRVRAWLLADSALATLVSTRVTPAPLGGSATLPAITYWLMDTVRGRSHEGADSLDSARVQVDCWAKTFSQAEQIAHLARRALNRYPALWANVQGPRLDQDPDTQAYRGILDVTLWHRQT